MHTSILKKGDQILVTKVRIAKTFFERFSGLMGQKEITIEDVLVFPKCNSVHTFFMRISIDVIFVSAQGVVTQVFSNLNPWRLLLPQKKVAHCIEMPSDEAGKMGISIGDSLSCEGVF